MSVDPQLDLFGAAPTQRTPPGVESCADTPDTLALAARLPAGLRLGTSSWSFPGWRGLIYGRDGDPSRLSRQGLAAYASHPWLRTAGIDSTFYALPQAARLAEYASQVPADFRFLIKAPARLTDPLTRGPGGRPLGENPDFLDAATAATQVVAPILEGLGERLGVLLLQFPPTGPRVCESPRRFAEDLYRFLRRLPCGPTYAVELRDAALLTPDLVQALRHGGAQPALAVHPRLPGLDEQARLHRERLPGPLVIRWVLRPNRGYEEARSRYQPFDHLVEPDPVQRRAIAELVMPTLETGHDVYVIANNKAEGCAPASLLALAETLVSGPLDGRA